MNARLHCSFPSFITFPPTVSAKPDIFWSSAIASTNHRWNDHIAGHALIHTAAIQPQTERPRGERIVRLTAVLRPLSNHSPTVLLSDSSDHANVSTMTCRSQTESRVRLTGIPRQSMRDAANPEILAGIAAGLAETAVALYWPAYTFNMAL